MEKYYFTFGAGQETPSGKSMSGKYVEIRAENPIKARERMFEIFGDKWAFQYDDGKNFHDAKRKWNWKCYAIAYPKFIEFCN